MKCGAKGDKFLNEPNLSPKLRRIILETNNDVRTVKDFYKYTFSKLTVKNNFPKDISDCILDYVPTYFFFKNLKRALVRFFYLPILTYSIQWKSQQI
jgi:hypothetical protein